MSKYSKYETDEYAYPYIPREYFQATMYACKLVRKYGTFNIAVKTAAKAYGVSAKELAKHVNARSHCETANIKRAETNWMRKREEKYT